MKIDLTHSYQQMSLEESSQKFVIINTQRVVAVHKVTLWSSVSAPVFLQLLMDTVLQGIGKTICYIDDILITGSTAEEHLQY